MASLACFWNIPDRATAQPLDGPIVRDQAGEASAFDIPAQPLSTAIEAFASATGLQVLYDARLADRRRSASVQGRFTPQRALLALLADSGLRARYTTPDAVVIVPAVDDASARPVPATLGAAALNRANAVERRYYALIQAGLRQSFCAVEETRSGDYRAAISIWLDSTGAVQRFKLLGSSGDQRRDGAIANAVRRMSASEPPPSGIVQPFTVVVVPSSAAAQACP